jgi:helicase
MRTISCGTSGTLLQTSNFSWQELNLDPPWLDVINLLSPNSSPRPVQALAFGEHNILESCRNLIVSAPTNSGKSLVGLLVLLETIRRQRRAILLEPLRALAREKADELERVAPQLANILGIKFAVKISTGDYRLEDEFLGDPSPGGEIIIATPERLESILRNPANSQWLETLGSVCVDEAHLISNSRRGGTLEYLITSLLCLPAPPRLVLLSATLGNVERAQEWLYPCDVVKVTERQPPLHKWVIELTQEEEANDIAASWIDEQLQNLEAQVLVFVYQTRSAEHLATLLNKELGTKTGEKGALAYHAQMSQGQRELVYQAFLSGKSRVVVTTTALAMGINLPTTHVLVRDNTFFGEGSLDVSDLLQMMGRAGRGNQEGCAVVLVRPNDKWQADELAKALQEEILPSLESALEREINKSNSFKDMSPATVHLASLLSRWQEQGATIDELQTFLRRSLGGQVLAGQVTTGLNWLESHLLAYQDPEHKKYHLTVLGKKATRAVLPLPLAHGYAQLLRDLLTIDSQDDLLSQWKPLDHLLVLDLLSERSPNLRKYSAKLVELVEDWCEGHSDLTPLLFCKWMRGKVENSRASEILGSLGVHSSKTGKAQEKWAYETAYVAVFRAIVLYERSLGMKVDAIERRFQVKGLEGIEEKWRDELLWLLSGLAQLLDVRTFYYHLKEDCQADSERIKRVKGSLGRMRYQVFELQEQIKYCSPLGPLLREIRRTAPKDKVKIGVQSIRRLEEAGVSSLKDLLVLGVDELMNLGVRRGLAEQIHNYVRRRMQ